MEKSVKATSYSSNTVDDLLDIIHFTEHLSTLLFGIKKRDLIFDIIENEFRLSRKYNCAILLLRKADSELGIARYSKPRKLIAAAEKIYGSPIEKFKFKIIPDGFFAKTIFDGESIHLRVVELLKEMFSSPLLHKLGNLFDISKRMCILSPLFLRGKCIGAIVMSSVSLAENLIPSVRYFSKNISLAIDLAEESQERELVQKTLIESERLLALERTALEDKNIALKEILKQIESEKKAVEDQIAESIDRSIIPIINNLKTNSTSLEIGYLDHIENLLREIASPYISNLSSKFNTLTPREITVCTMIKNGLSSKEIANLLKISPLTVNRYREFIRKKLNITNEKVSLTTFLNSTDFKSDVHR